MYIHTKKEGRKADDVEDFAGCNASTELSRHELRLAKDEDYSLSFITSLFPERHYDDLCIFVDIKWFVSTSLLSPSSPTSFVTLTLVSFFHTHKKKRKKT